MKILSEREYEIQIRGSSLNPELRKEPLFKEVRINLNNLISEITFPSYSGKSPPKKELTKWITHKITHISRVLTAVATSA